MGNNKDTALLDLELKVGLKEGFFERLLDEDDWSFIIKIHSFVEAACNHLLLYHLKEPNLSEIITRLDLLSKPTGKIVFLSKLELLGKYDIRLITKLAQIRNSLVHDIRNNEFTLKYLVESFDTNELKQFAIDFSPFETMCRKFDKDPRLNFTPDPNIKKQSDLNNIIKRAREDTKFHIWFGVRHTLTSILDNYGYSDYQNWMKSRKIYEEDEE